MNANEQTLTRFYQAFAALDAATMASCYAEDAQFKDEVFTLRGKREVAGMWTMLCEATKAKGKDVWRLAYSGIEANGNTGKAHWEAYYRFSATGRMVHNIIDGEFSFNDQGLIVKHRDRFDFWRWSRRAFGATGYALGWSPFLRGKVKATAAGNLKKFLANQK